MHVKRTVNESSAGPWLGKAAWSLIGMLPFVAGASEAPVPADAAEEIPVEPERPRYSQLRYDFDYPTLNYMAPATQNAFARLQAKIDRGEVKLEWKAPRGYLDSVLKALGIDKSSQVLVHSKTSLSFPFISDKTPRSIYFDDEVYVAWIPNAPILEMMAVDRQLGPVFYSLDNRQPAAVARLERETLRCLNCHDSFSLMGGGVPHFMMVSTNAGIEGDRAQRNASIDTTDATPMKYRFGGWYVTGHLGDQQHLGNIIVRSEADLDRIDELRRSNLESLQSFFDTKPYLTDRSDIVALLVLQHQVTMHNLITRAAYKAPTIVQREHPNAATKEPTWNEFSKQTQLGLRGLLEPLVRAMLNAGAMGFTSPIRGNAGYDAWFQKLGPRDSKGRSLRDLDLQTRLFRYPLSYLIYSDGFDSLPGYAKDYIYRRVAEVLRGEDQSAAFARLSAEDRQAILEILLETKPDFVKVAGPEPGEAERRSG